MQRNWLKIESTDGTGALIIFQAFILPYIYSLLSPIAITLKYRVWRTDVPIVWICIHKYIYALVVSACVFLVSRNEISCCGKHHGLIHSLIGLDFEYFRYTSHICYMLSINLTFWDSTLFHFTTLNLLQQVNLSCTIIALVVPAVESVGK
jgi:hypothetical protein